MKEFIEKLIGRLEESQERYDDVAFAEMNENGQTLDFEYAHGKKDGMSESIEIVNQLAEEYDLLEKFEQVDAAKNAIDTGWIPVSERLPTEKDDKVIICESNGDVGTGRYSESGETWFKGDMCAVGGEEVIAWKPLPEPYRLKGE